MFTGITEETGIVRRVVCGGEWGSITVEADKTLSGTKIGDSIGVNGVCLTVTRVDRGSFTADVMTETMGRTNLGQLKNGGAVNLERAMAAMGRFGGHMVSGHVDGTGIVRKTRREGNAVWVTIEAPPPILKLVVEKGSVAVDGISLTVAAVSDETGTFSVSVIPHTGEETTLLSGDLGRRVNLENDIIGKYVERLLTRGYRLGQTQSEEKPVGISEAFLRENGF